MRAAGPPARPLGRRRHGPDAGLGGDDPAPACVVAWQLSPAGRGAGRGARRRRTDELVHAAPTAGARPARRRPPCRSPTSSEAVGRDGHRPGRRGLDGGLRGDRDTMRRGRPTMACRPVDLLATGGPATWRSRPVSCCRPLPAVRRSCSTVRPAAAALVAARLAFRAAEVRWPGWPAAGHLPDPALAGAGPAPRVARRRRRTTGAARRTRAVSRRRVRRRRCR